MFGNAVRRAWAIFWIVIGSVISLMTGISWMIVDDAEAALISGAALAVGPACLIYGGSRLRN